MGDNGANPIEWKFARHGKFDAQKGGVANYAFNLNVDTFVREVVQNINDQRLSADNPAKASFIIEDVSGPNLKSLLKLIGWREGLEDHIRGVASGNSHQKESALRALNAVEGGKVRVLTVIDANTNGLTGGETTKNGNFAMLCRHELMTDAESKAVRGGSFGIGKSVLWAFSSASIVLFNSIPKSNPTSTKAGKRAEGDSPEERFIGRAYLPTHDVQIDRSVVTYKQDGWFGHSVIEDGDSGTVSVRADDAARHVEKSTLSRVGLGSGTSILIPFFENPIENEEQSLDELAQEIRSSIGKWFWPALSEGALVASVIAKQGARESVYEANVPEWASYFLRARNSIEVSGQLKDEIVSGYRIAQIPVPERVTAEKHKKFDGSIKLGLSKLNDDEFDRLEKVDVANSIAFVRGAMMVVQYYKSLPNSLPNFVGVLGVGRSLGNSENDLRAEQFFIDAEPPAHDKWILTAKLKSHYKGASGALESFRTVLVDTTKSLLGISSVSGEKVPRELAKLLSGRKLGRERNERAESFHTSVKTIKWISDDQILVEGRLKRMKGEKSWSAKVGVVLNNETGSRIDLDHNLDGVEVEPKEVIKSLLSEKTDSSLSESWSPGVRILAPEGVTEVDFVLKASAKRLGSETAKRSRANLVVSFNPKVGGTNE